MNKLFCCRWICLLLVCFLLAACATTTQPFSEQRYLNNEWSMQGRIAIHTQNKGESASIFWQQHGQQYALRIFGPLGLGAVQLDGQPGFVTLYANDGKVYRAASPEALLQQTLGWQLPVSNLVYWIRGEKAPKFYARTQYDAQHHLIYLNQQGWTINYLDYYQNGLPRLINCVRNQLSIRIVIDQWGG